MGRVSVETRPHHARQEDRIHLRRRHQSRPLPFRRRQGRRSHCRQSLRCQVGFRPPPTMAAPPTSNGLTSDMPNRPRWPRPSPRVSSSPISSDRRLRRWRLPPRLRIVQRRGPCRVPQGEAGQWTCSPRASRPAATPLDEGRHHRVPQDGRLCLRSGYEDLLSRSCRKSRRA